MKGLSSIWTVQRHGEKRRRPNNHDYIIINAERRNNIIWEEKTEIDYKLLHHRKITIRSVCSSTLPSSLPQFRYYFEGSLATKTRELLQSEREIDSKMFQIIQI